jgi:MerR HTH family regulatory protein
MPRTTEKAVQLYYRTGQLAEELGVQAQTVRIWAKSLGIQRWRFPRTTGIWYTAEDAVRIRAYAQRDGRITIVQPWLHKVPERLEATGT